MVCEWREAITLENKGEKIFGILHRPLENKPAPAVLICSGFAGNKCGKFRVFVTLGKELAKRGIAVFRFDYRGAGDSEGEFSDITLEGEINDVEICLKFLQSNPYIDPSRIGLLGKSLGGVVSVLTASRTQNIKSIALWAPVFKAKPWQDVWDSYQAEQPLDLKQQEIIKDLPALFPNLEFLNQFFTLDLEKELIKLNSIPLLHIHGEKDRVVKIEHSKEYETVRNGLDNSRFVYLAEGDHDFSNLKEQKIAIEETVQWFQKTL